VTTIEGALAFAGIPLAVVGVVFGAIFSTTAKPPRGPSRKELELARREREERENS
jgi:hypothetical protein